MIKRHLTVAAAIAIVLFCALATGVQAQSSAPAAAKPKPAAAKWTQPKTPWGHPDLQGEWTSDSARGIPRERPEQFAARARTCRSIC